jgi:hypothetical protein
MVDEIFAPPNGYPFSIDRSPANQSADENPKAVKNSKQSSKRSHKKVTPVSSSIKVKRKLQKKKNVFKSIGTQTEDVSTESSPLKAESMYVFYRVFNEKRSILGLLLKL